MEPKPDLTTLLNQIRRDGNEAAIADLLRHYEPLVIEAIHFALEPGNSMRPFITTQDILQSVNRKLIGESRKGQKALATGQEPLDTLDNGFGWLVRIATNLVIDKSRRLGHKKSSKSVGTDGSSEPSGPNIVSIESIVESLTDLRPGPEQHAEGRELLQQFLAELSPQERSILEARSEGQSWVEIGKQWERPFQRRMKELRQRLNESCEHETE